MPVYLGVSALQEGALGLCLMVTDLTEQRHYQELQRTQAALRESERRFREMIDALPVAIYTTDAQGRLTHFNPAAVEFSGRVPELGTDSWCVSWKLYRPDGTPLPHDECAMALALKEGRAVRGTETIAERPDGKRVWFMPYPTPLAMPKAGSSGALTCCSTSPNASRASKLLRCCLPSSIPPTTRSSAKTSTASSPVGTKARSGCSATRREEAIGRSITMLIPADRRDEESEILNRLKRGERVDHFDTIRIRKDGTPLQISLTISPVRDRGGRIVGASKIARDITARKEIEAALKEADRRKDEFLATLAHELRNPLAPIRNAVQILKAKGPPDPELQWGRDVIDRQVQSWSGWSTTCSTCRRITRNKLELRKERVELAAVVEAALETSRPLIEAGGHELTVTLPPGADPPRGRPGAAGPGVRQPAQQRRQVHRGRRPHPAERRAAGERRGRVGQGHRHRHPAEMLPRIFEMFTQVERALERSQGGLGIGLSLVKGLVELHGGSVEAHSDGPGQGSEFVVRLPVAVETPLPEPPLHRSEDEEPKPATKCRILIVDDNRDSADSLAMLLKIMGNEVGTAYDGEQAVEAAGTFRPDVVLLDIGMPKLNGYDACRRIREQPWGKGMVLIALTGWGQEEDRRRTEEAGFDHHMVKPVDPAALMKLLASLSAEQGGQLTKR